EDDPCSTADSSRKRSLEDEPSSKELESPRERTEPNVAADKVRIVEFAAGPGLNDKLEARDKTIGELGETIIQQARVPNFMGRLSRRHSIGKKYPVGSSNFSDNKLGIREESISSQKETIESLTELTAKVQEVDTLRADVKRLDRILSEKDTLLERQTSQITSLESDKSKLMASRAFPSLFHTDARFGQEDKSSQKETIESLTELTKKVQYLERNMKDLEAERDKHAQEEAEKYLKVTTELSTSRVFALNDTGDKRLIIFCAVRGTASSRVGSKDSRISGNV
ncbi:hypothetical protein F5880DRAFT_1619624, partial [Lentinula raphanica]